MEYHMGTAQLLNWKSFSHLKRAKSKISFTFDPSINTTKLVGDLKKIIALYPVLNADLVMEPEFINPMVSEKESNAFDDLGKVSINESNPSNRKETDDLNLVINVFKTDKIPCLDCHFNPIMLDHHSVLVFVQQAISSQLGKDKLCIGEISYKKYAAWSNELLNESEPKANVFWDGLYNLKKDLTDYPFRFEVDKNYRSGKFINIKIPWHITQADSYINQLIGTSPQQVMLALLQSYYTIFSDGVNLSFGVALDGRSFDQLHETIGPLTRVLPFAIPYEANPSLIQILKRVNTLLPEMEEWQEYATSKNSEQKSPIFDTQFNYLEGGDNRNSSFCDFQIVDVLDNPGGLLSWTFVRKDKQEFDIFLSFDETHFPNDLIQLIQNQFIYMAQVLIAKPKIPFEELNFLSEHEKTDIINHFQGKEIIHKHGTIISLYEKIVNQSQDKVALIYGKKQLTYGQLKKRVDITASLIRKKLSIQKTGVIGVLLTTSLDQVSSLLGIMKAGYTYLPIDEKLPISRKLMLLKKSKAIGVIHDSNIIQEDFKDYVCIDIQEEAESLIEIVEPSSDLFAYIIYTSGSTGEPKGVKIKHKNIINTLLWRINEYKFDESTVNLQIPNFSFDSSVEDIFCILLSGGKIILIEEERKYDYVHLNSLIEIHGVTNFLIVPSLYKSLLPHIKLSMKKMKAVTVAGEVLSVSLAENHYESLPQVQLINEYGPTECSVCATFARINPKDKITIGTPIDNMRTFVVDRQNRLLPIGMMGELLIEGPGVSDGYLNEKELTDNHFKVLDIYGNSSRYYKTGDFCRLSHDGKLHFIGRKDKEVKLRGHRINLTEIENCLLKSERIKECIVLLRELDNHKDIVAYFIASKDEKSIDLTNELENLVQANLPTYMMPTSFIKMQKWPLNSNDKIDHKKLLRTNGERKKMISPSTKEEKILLDVWCSVLNKKEISILDDFYKIGGDSIKSIQIAARIFELGYKLDVKEIFRNPVLKSQAMLMKIDEEFNTAQLKILGEVQMSPIQSYFFSVQGAIDKHYCQSVLLKLQFDTKAKEIQECLNLLVEHHDILRVEYKLDPLKQIITDKKIKIKIIELPEGDLINEIQNLSYNYFKNADLINQELFQVIIIKHANTTYILQILHHLLVDAVSWRILLTDFSELMERSHNRQALILPKKTGSFGQFTKDLEDARGRIGLAEKKYWQKISNFKNEGLISRISKNKSLIEEEVKTKLTINESRSKRLKLLASESQFEMKDLLLAAMGFSVQNIFSQDEMLVYIENHGRYNSLSKTNINRTVGWFTNVFPIILSTHSLGNIEEHIKQIAKSFSEVPNFGLTYCLERYSGRDFVPNASFKPFDMIFNYIGDLDTDINRLKSFEIIKNGFNGEIAYDRERESMIEVFVWIEKEKLEIEFIYSAKQIDTKTMHSFSETFDLYLEKILNSVSSYVVDSKFDYEKLSEEDFKTIFEE